MLKTIKLLEQRVDQAVSRLRELDKERRQLGKELISLREQLEASDAAAAVDTDRESGPEREAWLVQKAEAVRLVRDALAEIEQH